VPMELSELTRPITAAMREMRPSASTAANEPRTPQVG